MNEKTLNDNSIPQPGTRVVLRGEIMGVHVYPSGALGVIAALPEAPDQPYRVRMPDGDEVMLLRGQFAILASFQREGMNARDNFAAASLREYVIFSCVVGSRAYGLDHDASDTDLRGVYLPPARLHWSLHGVPEQIEFDATQEVYWELQKFLTMALKANPNVLECLYTPLVQSATPLAEQLLAMRDMFLSQLVYQTYNGYVVSQFKKLEQDLRTAGAIKWKHAMHLIRLLLSGIVVLREGYVPVRVEQYRTELLAIKAGAVPWPEVNGWRLALHAEFDAAFRATHLPERPDYTRADEFLILARQQMVGR